MATDLGAERTGEIEGRGRERESGTVAYYGAMSRRGMTPAQDVGNHKSQIPNPKSKAPERSGDGRMVGLVETTMAADYLRPRLAVCLSWTRSRDAARMV